MNFKFIVDSLEFIEVKSIKNTIAAALAQSKHRRYGWIVIIKLPNSLFYKQLPPSPILREVNRGLRVEKSIVLIHNDKLGILHIRFFLHFGDKGKEK